MKSNAKPALTPKLRFPEFQNAPAWEATTIGELGSFYYGKSAPKWSLEADAPTKCVRYGELYTKFGVTVTETYSRTNIDPASLRFSKGGEILVPRVGEKPEDFGKCCCYLPLANIAIGEMISVFETVQNPLFYTYYFRLLYREFSKVVEGQNVKNLYYTELEPLPIHRPGIPEQQKIADCLTSVDELIAAQGRKVDALKTHKKGLMQQLFPGEGESQPRLRFPEFQDAGEWEERKLGTVCEIQRGRFSHRPRNDPKFFGGKYPFIQTGDVVKSEGGAIIGSQSLNEDGLAVSKLFKPTIVLITIAANIGDTGLLQTEGCFTDSVAGLIPKREVIPVFLELIMRGQKEYLNKVATTGAQKNINNEILREVNILLPTAREQQRIADCLTSLDNLVDAQTQKLDALKTHKKGLMQLLFPASDEVEA
ncbi:restriction endonuclease subunit S [Mesorhizobium sp.]|uniref:restriction endonuclease subunit S n=1 Tax=Mesorhizobium sp. TaxID=1871066 RepID=UPI0025F54549|nr:restriction endonuclease subunit S [Mesorhizobium sp.]